MLWWAPYIGEGLITAGLIAAAVAVGALIGDLVWLLMAAARNRPVAEHGLSGGAHPDVDQAREVWELALMERGILPFLLGRLEEGQVGEEVVTPRVSPRGEVRGVRLCPPRRGPAEGQSSNATAAKCPT